MMRCGRGRLPSFLLMFAALLGCDAGKPAGKTEKPKPIPSKPGPVDADAPEEFTELKSGLKYRIRRKADGKKLGDSKLVIVNYRGWLDNGEIFDSTYGTGGSPGTVPLEGVVSSWSEGLEFIGEGGMIELEVPPNLGYGDRGSPPSIPPKAKLHFLIELIKVLETPKPPSEPTGKSDQEPGSVDADAPEEFTKTESGLKYRIRRNSDGKKPTKTSIVTVNYKGWLDDGKVFDSSYGKSAPAKFPLTGVIRGWTEGLQLIGVGGMIELEIPSNLAYGSEAKSSIPPNSTLHFVVELLEVR